MAIIFVIYNHTSWRGYFLFSSYFDANTLSVTSWRYWVYMIPSIICKIAVPCFFMISGALLLGKDEPISIIWKKRIPKFFSILFIASVFHYFLESNPSDLSVIGFLRQFYSSNILYNLWFLYAYICFLMMLPFLRAIVEKMTENMLIYLFALAIVFRGIIPMVDYFISGGAWAINTDLSNNVFIKDTVLYPLLGFGFTKYKPSQKNCIALLITGLLTLIPVVLLTNFKMQATGLNGYAHEMDIVTFWNGFPIILMVAVFTNISYIADNTKFTEKTTLIVKEIGSCVFGIYLIEPTIRTTYLFCYDFLRTIVPPYVAIWIYVLLVFVISLLVVYLSRKVIYLLRKISKK